jgi:hypothetical protein
MIVTVRIAARTVERTLTGDFNRQGRRVTGENAAPRGDDPFHHFTIMHCMNRRTLLQWVASTAAILPFERIRLLAQPSDLTPASIATLHEVAPTVLPSSLGADGIRSTVDKFVAWTRGYREDVALAHGYGHPRLQKTPASPVPAYVSQLTALASDAQGKGGRWPALDLETRRGLLDAAFTRAGVRSLPPRPAGQHIVVDLMAFYFRSSEANDECYRAMIQREVCRPIAITIRRPGPLAERR